MKVILDNKQQTLENIKHLLDVEGYDIYGIVKAGFFENQCEYPSADTTGICEHCGSKYKDEKKQAERNKKIDEYRKEESRLYNMFKDALFYYHDLDSERDKVQMAYSIAWDHGHASGYHEVANVFEELAELVR